MAQELQILQEALRLKRVEELQEDDSEDGQLFAKIEAFTKHLETKYPVELFMSYHKLGDYIAFDKIVVKKDKRKDGIGTKIMEDIVAFADKYGKTLALTPDVSYGGSSVSRLTKFYKRFGFIANKGRNKNYQILHTLIRETDN